MIRKIGILLGIVIIALIVINFLYDINYIKGKQYSSADFDIIEYTSKFDKDLDGIDDQTDFFLSVKKYIAQKPKYKSKYYEKGYPDDEYGVCTDVVAFGSLGAGYDLMELVYEDMINNMDLYSAEIIDKNIDFRRVKNLKIYFDRHFITLTTDIYDIQNWQKGDIVVLKNHIGVISDKRNKNGVCFVIHNANPYQRFYEEDILEKRKDIIGHYRIS